MYFTCPVLLLPESLACRDEGLTGRPVQLVLEAVVQLLVDLDVHVAVHKHVGPVEQVHVARHRVEVVATGAVHRGVVEDDLELARCTVQDFEPLSR